MTRSGVCFLLILVVSVFMGCTGVPCPESLDTPTVIDGVVYSKSGTCTAYYEQRVQGSPTGRYGYGVGRRERTKYGAKDLRYGCQGRGC